MLLHLLKTNFMKYLYTDQLRHLVPLFLMFYFSSLPLYSQDISWQKSIGGKQGEYLFDALPTPDNGSILAGSSVSVKSGDLQHTTQGSLDYFLWKLNEQGHQEWQKSLGGNQADYLYSIGLTQDGGYILGGSSFSGISGDKTDSCRGLNDYWIVKLDARGEIQWQKTLGGAGSDQLLSIRQTSDLGYILGGSSDSPASSEKKEPSRGSMDFWIIKLDSKGTILWQKTLGGENYELLKSIREIPGGYIAAGYSNSPAGFDKSENSYGENDYWLVRLDNQGTVVWEKSYGGKGNDELADMIVTRDGGFLLAGSSDSPPEGTKSASLGEGSDIWLIKTDPSGNPVWQQSVDMGAVDIPSKIMETEPGDFLIACSSLSVDTNGIMQSDYMTVKISASGEILWKKNIGGDRTDLLSCAAETRNGSLLLEGTSNSSPTVKFILSI